MCPRIVRHSAYNFLKSKLLSAHSCYTNELLLKRVPEQPRACPYLPEALEQLVVQGLSSDAAVALVTQVVTISG